MNGIVALHPKLEEDILWIATSPEHPYVCVHWKDAEVQTVRLWTNGQWFALLLDVQYLVHLWQNLRGPSGVQGNATEERWHVWSKRLCTLVRLDSNGRGTGYPASGQVIENSLGYQYLAKAWPVTVLSVPREIEQLEKHLECAPCTNCPYLLTILLCPG